MVRIKTLNMRIEETRDLLYSIYEGGMPYGDALASLTGIENSKYTRESARQLIADFINKFCSGKERKQHPLHTIPQDLANRLVEYLRTEMKGGSAKIYGDAPSVF